MKKLESNLPVVADTYRGSAPSIILDAGYEAQPAHVPLSHYLWILRRHAWKIAAFVTACSLATLVISMRLTPIYESTLTGDIDRQMPTGVLGPETMPNPTNRADQVLATPVKLDASHSPVPP